VDFVFISIVQRVCKLKTDFN